MKIAAVVVTYNRKKLLVECIEALLKQTYRIDKILIVDNNSTDNTYDYLCEKNILNESSVKYKKLEENIGGAGGFYEGIKEVSEEDYDWIWIMDDDTIPKSDSLEKLLKIIPKINGKISFLASSVYGNNGEFMNVPDIDVSKDANGYASWYEYLKHTAIKIKLATFVSLLLNNEAIKQCGYPVKNYFIWGDDTEYTLRLTKFYGPAYFIGESEVIHKRVISKNLSLLEETNKNRIYFHYYMIRNNLINKRYYYGRIKSAKYAFKNIVNIFKIIFNLKYNYKFLKVKCIVKGIVTFYFNRYDKNAFLNRFDVNVEYKK